MQHLMYKAMFELSNDRADFISLLFSKSRPQGLDANTPIQKMWDAYFVTPTDEALAKRNATRVTEQLTKVHKFVLTEDEAEQLRSVMDAFVTIGPAITTRGFGGGGNAVSFADLTGYSYDEAGNAQSFLSTEEHFRTVKALQDRNLIVPVSGDFGGPKAIRAIGAYLKREGGTVSAFYVSNVEQYLFQDGKARAFYDNVATLPMSDKTVFIRPYSLRRYGAAQTQSLCEIAGFLTAVKADRVFTNNDALSCAQ
jgi:hypothetical protein